MTRCSPGNRSRLALWPLLILALIGRLCLGSMPLPQTALDDQSAQLSQLAVLCDSQTTGHDGPGHHPPMDTGADSLLLGDMPADIVLVCVSIVLLVVSRQRSKSGFWRFPPVRGPPIQRLSGLFAQGPPQVS